MIPTAVVPKRFRPLGLLTGCGLMCLQTGWSAPVGPDAPVLWNRRVNQDSDSGLSRNPPAVSADGGILVRSFRGGVWCLEEADGSVRWSLPDRTAITRDGAMVIGSGNTAVLADSNGRLLGIDTRTGQIRWTLDLPASPDAIAGGPDGHVLVVTRIGEYIPAALVRVRVSDGTPEWTSELHEVVPWVDAGEALAVGSGVAAVAARDGISAVDARSGAPLWSIPLATRGVIVHGPDRTFLVLLDSGEMAAVSAVSGQILGRSPFPTVFGRALTGSTLRVTSGGRVLAMAYAPVSGEDPRYPKIDTPMVTAWESITGAPYLLRPVASGRFNQVPTPLVLAGQDRLLGGFDRGVNTYTLPLDERPTTNQVLSWSFRTPGSESLQCLTLTHAGRAVIVGRNDVWLVDGDHPPSSSGWPMSRRDPWNSATDPADNEGPPRILRGPEAPAVPIGADLRLIAVYVGEPPDSVTWYRDGQPIATNRHTHLVLPAATSDLSGTYHLVVETPAGSVASEPVTALVGHTVLLGVEGAGEILDADGAPLPGRRIVPDGAVLPLRAVAADDTTFIGWSDDPNLSTPDRTMTVSAAIEARARFAPRAGDLRWWSPQPQWLRSNRLVSDVDNVALVGTSTVALISVSTWRSQQVVHALDYATGRERWTFAGAWGTQGRILGGTNGLVYARVNSRFHALSEDTGEIVWQSPETSRADAALGRHFVSWERATPATADSILVARDPATGSLAWRAEPIPSQEIGSSGTLVIDGDILYVAGVRRLDLRTGRTLWQAPRTAPVSGSYWTVPGGTGMLNDTPAGASLQCLNWDGDRVLWSWSGRRVQTMSYGGRLLVVGSHQVGNGSSHGFRTDVVDPFTGSLSRPLLDGDPGLAPAIAADGSVWFNTHADIRVLDGTRGELLAVGATNDWYGNRLRAPSPTAVRMGPDGTVFAILEDGVAAYHGTAPPAAGPWPQAHGNPRSSSEVGPIAPALSDPADRRHPTGDPLNVRVAATSRQPMTLQWERDGTPIPGETNASLTFPGFTGAHEGTYRLIASSAGGTTVTREFRLLAGDFPGRWGLRLAADVGLEAHLETANDPAGPWVDLGVVSVPEGGAPIPIPGIQGQPAAWFRLRSDSGTEAADARLLAAPMFGFPLPDRIPGSRHRIEYVDRETGWENWQPLEEVPADAPSGWHPDRSPTITAPRFYRIVPIP